MKNYPFKAALFLIFLSISTMVTGIILFRDLSYKEFNLIPILIWVAIGIWSESYSVYLEEGNIHMSPADALFFAVYLTSGPIAAFIVIIATVLLRFRKTGLSHGNLFKTPFRLTLFNVCHYILILGVVHFSYTKLCHMTGLKLVPALVTAPLFFLLSCVLNALFYKLEEGRSFLHYLKEIFLPHFINGLAASFAVVIIAMTYPLFGFVSLFFFFIPIFATRLLYLENKGIQ